ncbi:hypothetical protein ACTTAI_19260 [Rhodobacter capsulatus]|uniref:hypothetical protein n=1 Tax=Rhodobacter capsulatus TaxID=1061 RepID=UPI0040272110
MDLQELYAAIMPALLQIIGLVLSLLLARAADVARTRWGLEIEAAHRDALHAALMSGVRSALMRGIAGTEVTREAVNHARKSVPDAIAALKPKSGVLEAIAAAKLADAAPGVIAGRS